ncbi:hypothetical protein QYE76_052425 [Lolium multiflorum]|uniref:CCHC-type domain-containing protein n=1 Tax=Lolium multiflorum TaxID=4521 RepID=A0AAD8SVC7_LOLMU|nr:hypothetical protein QYE76_052425 [Lolium multiflorum]
MVGRGRPPPPPQVARDEGIRPRRRNMEDEENMYGKLKFNMPKFKGEDDAEAYLSWALKVDKIFRIHNYSGAKKVAMASLEFEDYANTWWEQVVTLREEKGDPPIDTWEDMKEEMQARFVPTHYKTDLFNKLQKLKQGTKTVEEFFKEMELTMMRANIQESENQTIARFFNGLNYPIKKIVEFQQYSNMVELVHQASKAERQVNEDIKYSKSKQYFASKLATSTPTTSVKPSASSTPSKQPSIQSRMKQTVSSTASSKASTGPSNVTCFKCGTQGHKSFECKNTKVMITMENGDIETLSEGEYEALVQAAVANEEDYDEESGEDPLLCTHDPSPSLVVTRVLTTQPQAMEDQRCNIFQTRAGIGGKSIKVIIDGGSCHNLASTELCEKLNLTLRKHPHPYHVQWLSDKGNVKIQHTVTVNFKIGPYEDTVECDVVPMTVCHMLLGRPWQFDKKAIHDGFSNAYTFKVKDKKFELRPMTPSQIIADNAKALARAQHHIHHSELRGEGATHQKEFQDVFPDELPHGLPPLRGIGHRIDLIPGAPLPNRAAYRTNPEDTKEIQRQIQDLLAKGRPRVDPPKKERFPQERNSKLKPRGDGPFKVLKRINNNAYVIDIPTSKYLVSNTFNISDLSPHHGDEEEQESRTTLSQEGGDDVAPLANDTTSRPTSPPSGPMTRARVKALHDKVNSLLISLDLDTPLDGMLPHLNPLCREYVEHQDHGEDITPWSRGEEQLIEKMYTELDQYRLRRGSQDGRSGQPGCGPAGPAQDPVDRPRLDTRENKNSADIITWREYEALRNEMRREFRTNDDELKSTVDEIKQTLDATNVTVTGLSDQMTDIHRNIADMRLAIENLTVLQQQQEEDDEDPGLEDDAHNDRGAPHGHRPRGWVPLGRNGRGQDEEDGLGKPKFSIPKFEGGADVEEYLTWELKIEKLWSLHPHYSEDRKIKLASSEFDGYALRWWDSFVRVKTVDEYEYYMEMEMLMQRGRVRESLEMTMQRFLNGLKYDVKGIVRHYTYTNMNRLFTSARRRWITIGEEAKELIWASKRADYVKKIHEKTKELIEKKGKNNAARMNKKRKEMFKPGDLVWVHFRKDRFPKLRKSKLKPRGDGPYKVLAKINDNAYSIDLPEDEFDVSNSFNVADLTPYDGERPWARGRAL